jgi:hypothetical protein
MVASDHGSVLSPLCPACTGRIILWQPESSDKKFNHKQLENGWSRLVAHSITYSLQIQEYRRGEGRRMETDKQTVSSFRWRALLTEPILVCQTNLIFTSAFPTGSWHCCDEYGRQPQPTHPNTHRTKLAVARGDVLKTLTRAEV